MISGNYYKVRWKMKSQADKIVIVKIKHMVDENTANARVTKGDYKDFIMHFTARDIIQKFGQPAEFKKNFPEYWI